MKTYIYKVENFSPLPKFNRTITVYELKHNTPILTGVNEKVNTATHMGDYAVACKIIHANDGHKLTPDRYRLISKGIRVLSI